jgi:catechol-2,3-dioxygenase
VLYAQDLAEAATFYQGVLGLEMLRQHELVLVFDCGPGVLLIFDPEKARQPSRNVPSHGTEGAGHLAFSIQSADIDAWREHLVRNGIEIEMEIDRGRAYSIYFRDPAGNSLELATPGLWRS